MILNVRAFDGPDELAHFVNSQLTNGFNDILHIVFDAQSGKHILYYKGNP